MFASRAAVWSSGLLLLATCVGLPNPADAAAKEQRGNSKFRFAIADGDNAGGVTQTAGPIGNILGRGGRGGGGGGGILPGRGGSGGVLDRSKGGGVRGILGIGPASRPSYPTNTNKPNNAKQQQWLNEVAKQGPTVVPGKAAADGAQASGRDAKKPGGLLSTSDLGIASKTAQQAKNLPLGKPVPEAANDAASAGKPGSAAAPGTAAAAGGATAKGDGIKSSILGGVVVAAALAQNNKQGDAYDDHNINPGGGFVDYRYVDNAYVNQGYVNGDHADAAQQPASANSAAERPVPDGQSDGAAPAPAADPNSPDPAGTRHQVARPPQPSLAAVPAVPAKNALPSQVTVADRSVTRKIAREIDVLLAAQVESLFADLADRLLTDEAREAFLKQNITAEMDAATVQELKNALIDLNPDATEKAAKKLNLATEAWGPVIPHIKLTLGAKEFRKLIKEEHSLENINAFSRRFENALDEFDLGQAGRDSLSSTAQAMLDSLRIRVTLDSPPPAAGGEVVAAPKGEVPVLYFPPLAPAGKVFLLGGDTLAVGTATPGTLIVGKSAVKELMGVPSIEEPPIEAISMEKATATPREGTVLLNPAKLRASFTYTINGTKFTMGPGQSQNLPTGTAWVIEFDRGNGTQARYALADGAYTFTTANNVRDVTMLPCDVTIENPSLTGRFNLVVDQEPVSIPPGQALSLSSSYPIVVAFDRGKGDGPVYKRLTGGTISAGINSADGGWDLFEVAATEFDGPPQASNEVPSGQ